jgi:hypothetical protein
MVESASTSRRNERWNGKWVSIAQCRGDSSSQPYRLVRQACCWELVHQGLGLLRLGQPQRLSQVVPVPPSRRRNRS